MANTHTSLFLPEEHKVISTWLDVEPAEELSADLTIEKALSDLNLLVPTVSVRSTVDWAVAAILRERIQDRLPQWASVSEGKATLGRNLRDRAAERTVEITPTHLVTINWADSGPGFSWPEAYHVTYVPSYDEYIVTGSVDSTDVYGVTDFALGHFGPEGDIKKVPRRSLDLNGNSLLPITTSTAGRISSMKLSSVRILPMNWPIRFGKRVGNL